MLGVFCSPSWLTHHVGMAVARLLPPGAPGAHLAECTVDWSWSPGHDLGLSRPVGAIGWALVLPPACSTRHWPTFLGQLSVCEQRKAVTRVKVNQSCVKQTFGATFSISHSRAHFSPDGMADQADVGAKFQVLIQIANQLLNSYSISVLDYQS